MSTRGTYRFVGFNGDIAEHFYKHHDNYPSGAAELFWQAACACETSSGLQDAFVDAADPEAIDCHSRHADTDYRYDVFRDMTLGLVEVHCWKRLMGKTKDQWQLHYSGSLQGFLAQFRQPTEPQWL